MWKNYYSVTRVDEALQLLEKYGQRARIVAGATDLILELERGVRKGIETLIDISRVPSLDEIVMDENEYIHLGPMVTHNHCAASKLVVERALPLAQAGWEVGAPQIRNRGTVAGNLITASPANDTISPLLALGAQVRLVSSHNERTIPLETFYTGVRRTVMQPDEMMVDITFPAMQLNQRGNFLKLGLRRAQAISVVNVAILLTFADGVVEKFVAGKEQPGIKVSQAKITLGSVAPTIIHARNAEIYLEGRELSQATIAYTAELAGQAAQPIDDVRSSADYRKEMVRVCVSRGLHEIWQGLERSGFPKNPVFLWGQDGDQVANLAKGLRHTSRTPIVTHINGKKYVFRSGQHKTLLRLLREEALLTGTKEGCAEGECGACTVFLDGKAVMSCLVPAERAHGAEIVTVEGLSAGGELHPVQQAFVEEGAVQCGYCTPGFLMSAVKLLEERPQPTRAEIQQALTGNLCRCTGYYKIIQAIEKASQVEVAHGS